jgi:hypothetical protein
MDEKSIRVIKKVGWGLYDYVLGLVYWFFAIPILCVVAIAPKNRKNAEVFHYNFALERLQK